MKFDVLTLFPEMFEPVKQSILGRAEENKLIEVNLINIRDFSENKHKKVDDTPYGGGAGMVLTCQPIFDAVRNLKSKKSKVILMTPQCVRYNQSIAKSLSKEEHLILICGHYEGFDERIRSICDMELSIGDYVLTGGELAAMVVADATIRLLKGSIDENSALDESFENGLLEYPQYTKPSVYDGKKVPEVLLSGHHKNIEQYRLKMSLKTTLLNRPDLLEKITLDDRSQKLLVEIEEELKNDCK